MRRSYGDILPDPSDNIRMQLVEHRASYYQRIVEECPMCHGKGNYINKQGDPIRCECVKSLKIIIELLKSNFPQQLFNIKKESFFSRQCIELNIHKDDSPSKPFYFRSGFMRQFLNKKKYMINNSCSALFFGNNETGKTYAALYMLADFIEHGISGHYLRFKNYLNMLNYSYNNPDDRKLLRQIRDVKFLIIDELGKEHGKVEYATCELEELIKYRQDNLSCTILISNLDYQDFKTTYGNHVRSAFNKNFKILLFNPDAELRKRTRTVWPT